MTDELKRTPFYNMHVANGAKMVPFAGYDMPVQYPSGVMKEHLQTREKAGLFDVSHMGQVILRGQSYQDAAVALERLIPMDVQGLAEGRQRYGFFTNDQGGILDDLMFANRGDHIFMVVNAARKEADIDHLRDNLEPDIHVKVLENRALLALQGPSLGRLGCTFVQRPSALALANGVPRPDRVFVQRGHMGHGHRDAAVGRDHAGIVAVLEPLFGPDFRRQIEVVLAPDLAQPRVLAAP